LVVLWAALSVWTAGQVARHLAAEPEQARASRYPPSDPRQPDTRLPEATAHNAYFAGLAPGNAPGENPDVITVLDAKDRVLVRKKAGARKSAPAAASVTSAWEPDVFPSARLFPGPDRQITTLNVRDPSALVMPPTADNH
jgi:hypothetical protein